MIDLLLSLDFQVMNATFLVFQSKQCQTPEFQLSPPSTTSTVGFIHFLPTDFESPTSAWPEC
jgi:hypothetical protein